MSDCLFCGIVAGTVPGEIVDESELTVAFRDISPAAPVHVLVVPRRHITDASTLEDGDAEVLLAMFQAARRVARAEGVAVPERGYRLMLNVGPDALNSVPHLHLHILGGRPLTGHLG